jgi:probable rRNA maturation factor
MTVEVNNESGADVDERALAELGRFVLEHMHIDPLAELSVLIVDSDTMAALHQQWMNLPGPTDVMAFPMDGGESASDRFDPSAPPGAEEGPGEVMLGDVVLCPSVAAEQAAAAGHSADAELHMLCAHGILHLLGYDHGEPDEEREMFELQAGLLAEWTSATGRAPIRAPLPGTGGELRGGGRATSEFRGNPGAAGRRR